MLYNEKADACIKYINEKSVAKANEALEYVSIKNRKDLLGEKLNDDSFESKRAKYDPYYVAQPIKDYFEKETIPNEIEHKADYLSAYYKKLYSKNNEHNIDDNFGEYSYTFDDAASVR